MYVYARLHLRNDVSMFRLMSIDSVGKKANVASPLKVNINIDMCLPI